MDGCYYDAYRSITVTREEFIKAYTGMFGTSRREALETYKEVPLSYKREIVKGWNDQVKKTFYND